MPTPLRLDGLLAKVEGTYRTDSAPAAATDGVRIAERLWPTITIGHRFLSRRDGAATGTLRMAKPTVRKARVAVLDFAWEARGAGAAYSASVKPEADDLLRACGLSEVGDFTVSAEKYTYTPVDTGHASATLWAYAGDWVFKVVGARGSLVVPLNAGELGTVRFRITGFVDVAPIQASLPAVTYQATLPPPFVGASLVVGAWSPDVLSAEFDEGAQIVENPSANHVSGLAGVDIAAFDPRYTLRAKSVPPGTFDSYAGAAAATERTINQTLGDTQYNRLKLNITNAAYQEDPEHEDQDGFAGWRLPFQATDFALVFD